MTPPDKLLAEFNANPMLRSGLHHQSLGVREAYRMVEHYRAELRREINPESRDDCISDLRKAHEEYHELLYSLRLYIQGAIDMRGIDEHDTTAGEIANLLEREA